jgi:hypothetical protein
MEDFLVRSSMSVKVPVADSLQETWRGCHIHFPYLPWTYEQISKVGCKESASNLQRIRSKLQRINLLRANQMRREARRSDADERR